MKSTLFAAFIPFLLISTGCETPIGGCTEIGCTDAMNLNVYLSLTAESDYRVEILIDDDTSECSFFVNELGEIQDPICDEPEVEISSYMAESSPMASLNRQDPMPTPTFAITLRRGDIELVDFTLYQDDVESFAREITPSYEEFTPNGDRCPPVCRVATVDLFI